MEGSFNAQDAVRICDADGREVGRALVNYSASDICKVQVRAWSSELDADLVHCCFVVLTCCFCWSVR